MKQRIAFVIIGVIWIAIIGGLVGLKEYTLRTGAEVLLETRPVDPRDLFRGDYVILSYKISDIDLNILPIKSAVFNPGETAYVQLRVDSSGIGAVKNVLKNKPADGLFMKGEIQDVYASGSHIAINYGIESYFVPEGEGLAIERERNNLLVRIVVDKNGNSVIKELLLDGKAIDFGQTKP